MAEIPRLKDDCFALPEGAHWTPVDQALAHLREQMRTVVGVETLPITQASGRILATDVVAKRANPPYANAAVDGYGFAYASLTAADQQELALVDGRSAAGAPFYGDVPLAQAIRILTGASLPQGVDTVIMQEDVQVEDGVLRFESGIKPGANCRDKGEDILAGAVALEISTRLGPQELGLLVALGVAEVKVYVRLRVGVLSTGDELRQPFEPATAHQIYDANRPMLLALLHDWGFEAVDLGVASDNRAAVVAALDKAAECCDALLTSGGASAGDEDHMAAVLADQAQLNLWRIAIKPGRPLALAMWRGLPVFGLPGNPVAAFTTALVFARPALGVLQGQGWQRPRATALPATFTKRKKAGRREFLRARRNEDGAVETFASEGSGRISGLAWAEGFVELPDEAVEIKSGDFVRFIPFCEYR
ncbi:MAG: molybdopterin molybdenumtransferase MoeA [Rhodobacteraceae bacterium]|nr:molybdopterin molybdenumtransferase MoeA [Paracoccaceae bacterium]